MENGIIRKFRESYFARPEYILGDFEIFNDLTLLGGSGAEITQVPR